MLPKVCELIVIAFTKKSLNFIYPFKFYSNFSNKNINWLHFSWAIQYQYMDNTETLKRKMIVCWINGVAELNNVSLNNFAD